MSDEELRLLQYEQWLRNQLNRSWSCAISPNLESINENEAAERLFLFDDNPSHRADDHSVDHIPVGTIDPTPILNKDLP